MAPRPGRRLRGGPHQFFAELTGLLVEAAVQRIDLDVPVKEGQLTKREELTDRFERTGQWSDELEMIEIPIVAQRVFEAFWEIAGPEALTWLEIEAYQRGMRVAFEPWETRAVMMMDRAVRSFVLVRAIPREGVDG